jgi:hypothetical protein
LERLLAIEYWSVSVANSNSSIEINSAPRDFRVNFNFIWNYFGYGSAYNKAKNTVIDIKQDLKELPKDAVVTILLNSIVYVWDWELGTINFENRINYDVSAYLLNIFLNETWNRRFQTGHWISSILQSSQKYTSIKNDAIEKSVNINILEWEKKLIDQWDGIFSTWDLYYWIHLYKWRSYIYKDNLGKLYSIVEFEDKYDFAETKYTSETSDFLNHMWYHYQEELKWNKFTWVSENIYLIK